MRQFAMALCRRTGTLLTSLSQTNSGCFFNSVNAADVSWNGQGRFFYVWGA